MKKNPVLSAEAKAWIESVEQKFNLEPHDRMLLVQAAQVHDEIAEAKALIAKEGLTIKTDRGGKKANPAADRHRS
jgi:phage terminase small subunit